MSRKKPKTNESGVAMIECTISLLPFTLLLIGFLQLSIAAFHIVSLQYVLNRTSRWASIGHGSIDGRLPVSDVKEHAKQLFETLGLRSDDLSLHVCPASEPNCSSDSDAGSSQFVAIIAKKDPESILGVGSIPIAAQILVKNEPF